MLNISKNLKFLLLQSKGKNKEIVIKSPTNKAHCSVLNRFYQIRQQSRLKVGQNQEQIQIEETESHSFWRPLKSDQFEDYIILNKADQFVKLDIKNNKVLFRKRIMTFPHIFSDMFYSYYTQTLILTTGKVTKVTKEAERVVSFKDQKSAVLFKIFNFSCSSKNGYYKGNKVYHGDLFESGLPFRLRRDWCFRGKFKSSKKMFFFNRISRILYSSHSMIILGAPECQLRLNLRSAESTFREIYNIAKLKNSAKSGSKASSIGSGSLRDDDCSLGSYESYQVALDSPRSEESENEQNSQNGAEIEANSDDSDANSSAYYSSSSIVDYSEEKNFTLMEAAKMKESGLKLPVAFFKDAESGELVQVYQSNNSKWGFLKGQNFPSNFVQKELRRGVKLEDLSQNHCCMWTQGRERGENLVLVQESQPSQIYLFQRFCRPNFGIEADQSLRKDQAEAFLGLSPCLAPEGRIEVEFDQNLESENFQDLELTYTWSENGRPKLIGIGLNWVDMSSEEPRLKGLRYCFNIAKKSELVLKEKNLMPLLRPQGSSVGQYQQSGLGTLWSLLVSPSKTNSVFLVIIDTNLIQRASERQMELIPGSELAKICKIIEIELFKAPAPYLIKSPNLVFLEKEEGKMINFGFIYVLKTAKNKNLVNFLMIEPDPKKVEKSKISRDEVGLEHRNQILKGFVALELCLYQTKYEIKIFMTLQGKSDFSLILAEDVKDQDIFSPIKLYFLQLNTLIPNLNSTQKFQKLGSIDSELPSIRISMDRKALFSLKSDKRAIYFIRPKNQPNPISGNYMTKEVKSLTLKLFIPHKIENLTQIKAIHDDFKIRFIGFAGVRDHEKGSKSGKEVDSERLKVVILTSDALENCILRIEKVYQIPSFPNLTKPLKLLQPLKRLKKSSNLTPVISESRYLYKLVAKDNHFGDKAESEGYELKERKRTEDLGLSVMKLLNELKWRLQIAKEYDNRIKRWSRDWVEIILLMLRLGPVYIEMLIREH